MKWKNFLNSRSMLTLIIALAVSTNFAGQKPHEMSVSPNQMQSLQQASQKTSDNKQIESNGIKVAISATSTVTTESRGSSESEDSQRNQDKEKEKKKDKKNKNDKQFFQKWF